MECCQACTLTQSYSQLVCSRRATFRTPVQVEAMVSHAVHQYGCLDILVSNAGIVKPCEFLDMSEEDWDAVLRVNLKGVFLVSLLNSSWRGKGGKPWAGCCAFASQLLCSKVRCSGFLRSRARSLGGFQGASASLRAPADWASGCTADGGAEQAGSRQGRRNHQHVIRQCRDGHPNYSQVSTRCSSQHSSS